MFHQHKSTGLRDLVDTLVDHVAICSEGPDGYRRRPQPSKENWASRPSLSTFRSSAFDTDRSGAPDSGPRTPRSPVRAIRGRVARPLIDLEEPELAVSETEGQVATRAMEEEDTGMVRCCRQPSDEEGRLEREKVLSKVRVFSTVCKTMDDYNCACTTARLSQCICIRIGLR